MTTFQTDAPITPLRQRMQQDMVMRGLDSHTQQDYVRHVRNLAAFLGRPPNNATTEDIRHYQLRQHETGVGPATINSTVSVLRFFVHCDAQPARSIAYSGYNPQSAQTTRGSERGGSRSTARGSTWHQIQGSADVAYGADLRVSEVAHLKVDDIDSTLRLICVEQGKIERWHQTLKNHILLENYFLPGDLMRQIGSFISHYNHHRYHESPGNLTPAHVNFGRGETILLERERVKRINQQRLQYRNQAA